MHACPYSSTYLVKCSDQYCHKRIQHHKTVPAFAQDLEKISLVYRRLPKLPAPLPRTIFRRNRWRIDQDNSTTGGTHFNYLSTHKIVQRRLFQICTHSSIIRQHDQRPPAGPYSGHLTSCLIKPFRGSLANVAHVPRMYLSKATSSRVGAGTLSPRRLQSVKKKENLRTTISTTIRLGCQSRIWKFSKISVSPSRDPSLDTGICKLCSRTVKNS